MLRQLRGRVHRVLTGVCVWPLDRPEPLLDVAVTQLRMEELADDAIDEYLATGHWEGKAGAFGYQDGLGWVRVESGSESNVVGLPMELLAQMLAELESDSR
jgi:septum formation protein